MPYNYELENYRLHSIVKIKFLENKELGFETRDLSEGLAIEKDVTNNPNDPNYIVIAFVRPSKDSSGCVDIEFVTERITEIQNNEWPIFMDLYYRAHRALLNKDSIYYESTDKKAEEKIVKEKLDKTSDRVKEVNEFTNTIFRTKCLICGEDISYPAVEWYNSDDHASPYIKVCKHCKDAILKARADMDWEEEVGRW